MSLKITVGIITLNADFFLKQVLESVYPFAHKIIIADGAVTWWARQGVIRSTDDTIKIIQDFPDPEMKILLVKSGVYKEKDDQCRAWFAHVPADTDYVFCVDSDEVHSWGNMEKLITFLEKEKPTSVGFKSDTFYGGFDRIMGGFERDHSFKRVLQYLPGCIYRTHRQPTLSTIAEGTGDDFIDHWVDISGNDISGNQLYEATGITMQHYSYVSAKGVYNKIRYYEGAVIAPGQCIPNYFRDVWSKWVTGDQIMRNAIEMHWNGVHEFTPAARGNQPTFTEPFTGVHPLAIQKAMPELLAKFDSEVKLFV